MSEPLKVGDRVRVVKYGDRVFNAAADLTKYKLDGQTGFIVTDNTLGSVVVRLPEHDACLCVCCLELVKPRRTFEKIISELAEKPEFKGKWEADFDFAERTVLLTNERGIMLHFYDDGEVRFETDIVKSYSSDIFTPAQLAAISAACAEIAENWEAEHGKGEA